MPKNNNEQVNKVAKKNKRRPLRHRGGGGLGCLLGLITTFLCIIAIALTIGYFVLDRFLATNFDMSANDCIGLVSSIWSVDESKVITEGKATEDDRENFYSTLGDTLFIKDELVSSLVDTAVDEYVIPMVNDVISGDGYLSSAPKMESGNEQDLQTYLISLLEDGVIDQDKIKEYFENPLSAEEKYEDYFVMDINGKGIVSTVDYVVNRVLSSNPETKAFANTFGISQIKFTSTTQNGLPFKQINLVLDVKVQKAIVAFLESQIGNDILGDNAKYIRQVAGILPQRLLLSVDLNVKGDSASVDFRINNLTNDDVSKWFDFAKKLTGTDFKEIIDESVNSAYGEIRSLLIGYVDINNLIQNGSLSVDVFDILAKVLNEQLGLEGENTLTKIDATTTISNALYANLDVNGKAICDIVEEEAPYFVSSSWKKDTEKDFLDWLQTNLAFKDKDGLKKAIAEFKDETGKIVIPTEYTAFLEFIDTQYIRNGTAFLKEGLTFDDRFIAYAFEKSKNQLFASAGYEGLGSALSLQYVSITQEKVGEKTHDFLSLGMSAKTEELCNALGYSDFAFVSSLIGKEIFLCAKADVTLDTNIERVSTQLRINGLSTSQTLDILTTVKKVMGYDVVDEFINKNINVFIGQILDMTSSSFALGFSVKQNEDGSTTGMLILPSVSEVLEIVCSLNNIPLESEKIIDAIGAFLTARPVMKGENYTQFLVDTSRAITGKEDSFESYSQVVSSAFLSKYFLSEDSNLDDILTILIKAISQKEGALDDLLGTEEKEGLVKISDAYFTANPNVENTKPIIDGHTIAYIIDEGREVISTLLGEQVASYLQYIDVKDVKIENGYLSVIVSTTPKKFLSIDGVELDKYVTNFICGIFGGENEEVTLTLKINIGNNKEKVFIYVQDMEKSEMQSIFDLLRGLGITFFDFEDQANPLVEFANNIAKYVKDYAVVEDNTISLPSIFGLISAFVGDKNLTEEITFSAVKSLITTNANQSTYNEYLTDANEILTGDMSSGYSYEKLVKEYVEKKYIIKEEKSIGSILESFDGADVIGSLTGDDGVIDLNRDALATYFDFVAPTLEKANPTLDGHTLAYIIDKYKEEIAKMVSLDQSALTILNNVTIGDVVVDDNGVMNVRVIVDLKKLISFVGEFEIANQFFNVLQEGKEVLSITLSIPLKTNDTAKIIINDMDEEGQASINSLLKALGLSYFDFSDDANPLTKSVKMLRNVVKKYMPYDNNEKVFKMYSLFDVIAKYIDFDGKKLTSDQTYTLVRSLSTYDDGQIKEEDYSHIDYEENLNALTSRYYAIDDGAGLIRKMMGSSGVNANNVSLNKNTIKNGSGDYKKSFVYGEENLLPLISSFDFESNLGEGFTLNKVDVIDNNVISMNLIVSLSSLGLDSIDFASNVLPQQISVTVPISFGQEEHGNWQIDYMDNFDDIKEIFSIIGFSLDETIDDARDMVNDLIGEKFTKYGIKFVSSEEDGLQFPALTTLYTFIDDTLSEEDIIVLVDNIVCYSEDNIVKGEDFATEYQKAFNDLAKEYYAIDNGFALIDTALNSQVDVGSLQIDKAQLNTGKYNQSFVYEDKYLLNFINGLKMGVNSAEFTLNRVRVSNDNELSTNVIVNVSALMGNGNLGAFGSLLPEQLSVNIPIMFGSNSQNAWSIDGIEQEDLEKIKTTLLNFEVDIDSQVNEQRENIISSVGSSFDEYGMQFVGATQQTSAGLLMPSLTTLYTTIDKTFTEDEFVTLIEELVLYDEETYAKEVVDETGKYKTELNTLTLDHYAITDGYDTIAHLVNNDGFSIDDLKFDVDVFRAKDKDGNFVRDYVNSFIYKDEYLASFIKNVGLIENDGFIVNQIEVIDNNYVEINLLVDVLGVSGEADYGAMTDLLPARLSVVVPISFNSAIKHGNWTIEGMNNSDGVVEILTNKVGVDLNDLVEGKRSEIAEDLGQMLKDKEMAFAIEGEEKGLKMPSICTLYAKEKGEEFTEKDAIYLFDNLVCYEKIYHSMFPDEETKNNAKQEFVSIMREHYLVKDYYTGEAPYKEKDKDDWDLDAYAENVEVGFDMLLMSLGFTLQDYQGYYVPTEDLMDIPENLIGLTSLMTNKERINNLTNDVLISNEILTLWIESVGVSDKFELEQIIVTANDHIKFTGFISMEEVMGEGDEVCATAKSIMPDALNVTMEINLKPPSGENALVDYYIEDLVGTYGENEESDAEKSMKLLDVIKKLDPDLHIDEDMFNDCANEVSNTINDMLDKIAGKDPFNANNRDDDENNDETEKAAAVFFNEGEVPQQLAGFNTNSGIYLPDGLSFAYHNSEEFKKLFDDNYQYISMVMPIS